uniref:Uncharacterized protein n=1 Tax=Sus scrofa TaxID=9823 RepID=A0A8D0W1W6_PIG
MLGTTTSCSSQVRQNYHQDSEVAVDSQINLALYASYVFLSITLWGTVRAKP